MTKAVASSAGWPGRFIGTWLPNFSTASSGKVDGISGVQIRPSATALARISFWASSCARPAVKFWMAPLVSSGLGVSALMDAVLMMAPPGRICGTAALVS
jgi:hypothetical protein